MAVFPISFSAPRGKRAAIAAILAPESNDNLNTTKVGKLGLTDADENNLVSFMQTLSDGFMSRD